MTIRIETMAAADAAGLVAINNAAVPAVNELVAAEFALLAAMGDVRVARLHGRQSAGFVLTMKATTTYDSLNYRWFQARFPDFFYIDRVVVDITARGMGIGRALYEDTISRARAGGHLVVCSEVNVEPPNPDSMLFHTALGFRRVAERRNEASGKTVAMMVCELG